MAPFQWYGGKGNFIKRILPHIDYKKKMYCEPFAGAASMLWHKDLHKVEVLNDLNSELVNLFRVLQNKEQFNELQHRIEWTLYSREEFQRALATESENPVDNAWAFFVKHNQGFSGEAKTEGQWSRVFIDDRGMSSNTNKWRGRMKMLEWWHDRLSRVQIENVDAVKCIKYWSKKGDAFFYLDPPYVADVRKYKNAYAKEMNDDQHKSMIEAVLATENCSFVISGYESTLYQPLLDAGFEMLKFETYNHSANNGFHQKNGMRNESLKRTECLYLSPKQSEETFNLI